MKPIAKKKISKFEGSLVFFISPKKINKVIPELKNNFSGRKIVFCREISKLYEEYIRMDIDDVIPFKKEPKEEHTKVSTPTYLTVPIASYWGERKDDLWLKYVKDLKLIDKTLIELDGTDKKKKF